MTPEKIMKVKLGGAKIEMKWSCSNGDELEAKFTEEARPELGAAMSGLVGPCLELLELPEWYGDGLRASGLSLSYADGVMGATVTLQKTLKDAPAPLIMNTPHLPQEPYSDGGACLPGELSDAIELVVDEAKRYLQGERRQMDLFDPGAAANDAASEPGDVLVTADETRVSIEVPGLPAVETTMTDMLAAARALRSTRVGGAP